MASGIENVATKEDVALFQRDLLNAHNQILTWICVFGVLQITTILVATYLVLSGLNR